MLTLLVFTMHHLEKMSREGLRTRDAHLLEALDKHPRVGRLLIVDRPTTAAERLLRRRANPRVLASTPRLLGLRKADSVLAESKPLVRPLAQRSRWWLRAYTPAHLSVASATAIHEAARTADATLSFVPTAHPLWPRNGPVIFDLLDNWLIHPQLGERFVDEYRTAYRRSFDLATWVTANAEGTSELARSFGREPILLPNAVDQAVFQLRARTHLGQWQRRLARLPRPWFIYAGKMQERVDVALLERLRAASEGTLVLAGPVLDRRWMRRLTSEARVVSLGDVRYEELPGLLAAADVGLIAHRVGRDFGGDPLKAHEYAAVGLRYVSTPVSSAGRLAELGEVATTGEEFVRIALSLGVDSRGLAQRLAEAPSLDHDSWDSRADTIVRLAGQRTPAAA